MHLFCKIIYRISAFCILKEEFILIRNNRTRLRRQRKINHSIRIGGVFVLSGVIFFGAGRFIGGITEAIASENKNPNTTYEEIINKKIDTTANLEVETSLNNEIKQSDNFMESSNEKIQTNNLEQSSKKNEWNLLLVNPWNYLPDNFDTNLIKLNNGHFVDERAYPDLQKMMDDARAEGLSPVICSSYRTVERQTTLFHNEIEEYLAKGYSQEEAEIEAARWVAVPGTSEHHTGLALDIVSSNNQQLNEEQELTPEQKWLIENSYKYGFILRFPKDKTDITGINYEPWHYRYVGIEAAKEIYEKGICLEEYLEGV